MTWDSAWKSATSDQMGGGRKLRIVKDSAG